MDTAILLWIHAHSTPALDALFRLSHELGTVAFCTVLVAALAAFHLARREPRHAVAWVAVGVLTYLLPELLKAAFARPRPSLWPWLVAVSGYSFPSGHAVAGMAFYPLLAWVLLGSRPGSASLAYALGALVGIFVGFGRLYLGVHWPSDVLAGWALGAAGSAAALAWLARAPAEPGPSDDEVTTGASGTTA